MNTSDKIGIIGGGVEGIAVAKYLIGKSYADVTIFDEKESLDVSGIEGGDEVLKKVKTVLGAGAFAKASECVVLFRSPGIHPKKLDDARAKGVKITSTTQYFFENCPCPIVGITGTKGKGTTSTLIHLMLKEAEKDSYLGGNIGESPLNFLDKLTKDSVAVMELSSFQLQDMTMSPHVAVVVMTTSEHLDYHADQNEYWEAKMPIVKFQKPEDFCIVNLDYEYGEKFQSLSVAQKFPVSRKQALTQGAHIEGPAIIFCAPGVCQMVGNTGKIALLGQHNQENILAAVAAARVLQVPVPAVQKVMYSFAGLPHRLEFVKEVNEVKFYNDSFSTTPETSVAAAYAFKGPVWLIAGGSEKNSDFTEWGMKMQECANLKGILLMGVTADRMQNALHEAAEKMKKDDSAPKNENSMGQFPVKVYRVKSLEEALAEAQKMAVAGDTVVMSPACASYDMFQNYKKRGEKFRELVMKLS